MDRHKARFLADKKAAETYQTFVDSDLFARAADAAMLQVVNGITDMRAIDPTTCAAAYQQVQGARQLLSVLRNLGVPEKPAERKTPPGTLDYKA